MNLIEAREELLKLAIAHEGKPLLVNRYGIAKIFGVSDLNVRRLMSYLRHDKQAYFIPAGKKGLYVLYVKGLNDEAVKVYVMNQIAHIKSSYFNNVVPFMDIVKEMKDDKDYNRIVNIVGQLELALGEQDGQQRA